MKRVIKNKFSGTKKLVRAVLSKPSISSHESTQQNSEILMAEEALLKNELDALKDQILNLKAAISALQGETEQKEVSIANLAREKEKVTLDLLRTRRSNCHLTKQLEDERKFYYKEKEIYCQEMNECKRLKRLLSGSGSSGEEKTVEEYKSEILRIKHTLGQTLEANYNLSIKFLRMKNTKTCLKTELQTVKLEHEKLENQYKTKIEDLTADLNDVINDKLNTGMSPSSKKYLQLVKQNSCLVYENLCLQLEVDNLNFKYEKSKLERTKSETNSRLQYIHHEKKDSDNSKRKSPKDRSSKTIKMQDEAPEKLEREPQPCCSHNHHRQDKDDKIVKIYERKALPGIPQIKIVNEKKPRYNKTRKKKDVKVKNDKEIQSNSRNQSYLKKTDMPDYEISIDDSSRDKIANKNSEKLELFQVSNNQSSVSSNYVSLGSSIIRSHSSPDIVLSTAFIEKT